jgi:predicted ATPase/DNA-binding SARP family transcriptional activator
LAIEVGILGPLEVTVAGVPVVLGGQRPRALLARLALDAPRPVSSAVLVDEVWAGEPPATAAKTLQKYVVQLRRVLGADAVRTTGGGYALDVEPDDIDARRFERLLVDDLVDDALALWRGEVLADVPELAAAEPERARLDELRLAALERRFERALHAGRHRDVIGDLAELVERHPLRERLVALLVRALYGADRQVEALRAYERHRRRWADEFGLEPAPELRELEQAVLRHELPVGRAAARAGNVHRPLSPTIGRDAERAAVTAALRNARLLTLVGPGGAGKTRLATEVAVDRSDQSDAGTWFVDLAGVLDVDLLAQTVASTLRVADHAGDEEEALFATLGERGQVLLVLDNCEHVVEGCAAFVGRLLRRCRSARVLATSRCTLGVDGEVVLPVGPLSDDDAVELLQERARGVGSQLGDPDRAMLLTLCRSVDSLPLAIELVAGQLRVLTVTELAARLDDRLRFSGRRNDAPERQRTLHDTIAWSHRLLPSDTQAAFSRLGVFSGTFTIDAAAAVCATDDVLSHLSILLDHSMLVRDATDDGVPARYRLLETLRLFALEQLVAAGDEASVRRAHAAWYEEVARRAGPHLHGPEEAEWTVRLDADDANLHAAMAWSKANDPPLAARLGVALWPYWDVRWRERHAVPYLESVIALAGTDLDDHLRAWLLTAAADLAANPGEATRPLAWAADAVPLFRRCDDRRGLAAALFALGSARGNAGMLAAAESVLAEAMELAESLDDDVLVARGLNTVSFVATRRGDHRRALTMVREELARWQAVGSVRGTATALRHIATACRYLGDLDDAERACHQALVLWESCDDQPAIAHVRSTLADIAALRGGVARARRLYGEALAGYRAIGDRRCTASTFKNLASLAVADADAAQAAALVMDAIALRVELGDRAGLAECFETLAAACSTVGRHADAVALLDAAARERVASGALPSDDERAAAERLHAAAIRVPPSAEVEAALDVEAVLAIGRSLAHAAHGRDAVAQTTSPR